MDRVSQIRITPVKTNLCTLSFDKFDLDFEKSHHFLLSSIRKRGEPIPYDYLASGEDTRKKRDASLFFNQEVTRRFLEAKQAATARGAPYGGSPWTVRLNKDGSVSKGGDGKIKVFKYQFFPSPYVQNDRSGRLFNSYKGRFAGHVNTLLTKLGVACGLFRDGVAPCLYRCGGFPA
jgi:hypothetical protein